MNKNLFLYSFLILTLLSINTNAQQSSRPNIVYIMSDDHAAEAIGIYKSRLAVINPTPNIDRLAKEGMVFKAAFCNNSICT